MERLEFDVDGWANDRVMIDVEERAVVSQALLRMRIMSGFRTLHPEDVERTLTRACFFVPEQMRLTPKARAVTSIAAGLSSVKKLARRRGRRPRAE